MKKKKHLSERLSTWQFIALFALSYALAMGLGTLLRDSLLFSVRFAPLQIWLSLMAVVPLLLAVVGEGLVLKVQYKWSAHKWIIASLFGVILLFSWHLTRATLLSNNTLSLEIMWFVERILTIILGITQFMVLRQYIKRAWLWVVAVATITITHLPLYTFLFTTLGADMVMTSAGRLIFLSLLGGVQGLVLGTVMMMLCDSASENSVNKSKKTLR